MMVCGFYWLVMVIIILSQSVKVNSHNSKFISLNLNHDGLYYKKLQQSNGSKNTRTIDILNGLQDTFGTNLSHQINCTEVGRFPDLADATCQKYIICSKQCNGGNFLKKEYKCPGSSKFNVSTGNCTDDYICHCGTHSETDAAINKPLTQHSVLAKSTLDTNKTMGTTCNPSFNTLECEKSGRFPELKDSTCQGYFLCSKLSNGTFIKKSYKCPNKSTFDPTTGRCSNTYSCSTSMGSTTIQLPQTISNGQQTTTSSAVSTVILDSSIDAETVTSVCQPSLDELFRCRNTGRYPDPNDFSCEKYFLCSVLHNGTFIKNSYKCPTKSKFHPISGKCSTEYTCPCSSDQSSPLTGSATTSNTFNSKTDAHSLETASIKTTTPFKDESWSVYNCTSSGKELMCKKTERFPNINDSTCQKYFLCSHLQTGTFIKKYFKCPTTLQFYPANGMCSTEYVCPCSTNSTTGITVAPTSSSISTKTQLPTTQFLQYTSMAAPVTTETSPTYDCTAGRNTFVCEKTGRFSNFNDSSCKKYFLCLQLRNSTFLKKTYECPTNSKFNPATGKCSTGYTCPCSSNAINPTIENLTSPSVSVTTESPATPFVPNMQFTHSRNETSLITGKPTTTQSSVTIVVPNTPFTVPSVNQPSPVYDCISSENEFVCGETGRFSDPNDKTCQKYILCSHLLNGTFIRRTYKCPTGSKFHPTNRKCSIEYICPCSSNSTNPVTEILTTAIVFNTTQSPTTSFAMNTAITSSNNELSSVYNCTETVNELVCDKIGRFPDLNDSTCQNYFLCSHLQNGIFIKKSFKCPITSKFSPANGKCSTEYVCPCSSNPTTTRTWDPTMSSDSATTPSPTTRFLPNVSIITSATDYTLPSYNCRSPGNAFECEKTGRFPNFNDRSCQNYFLCSHLQNGTFIRNTYKCPANSKFHPRTGKCSTAFTCPCSYSTTIPITGKPTTVTVFASTESSSSSSFVPTTLLTIHSSATDLVTGKTTTESIFTTTHSPTTYNRPYTSFTAPIINQSSPVYDCTSPENEFVCIETGRFPDLSDITCQKYFLCLHLQNDTFIRKAYKCPANSKFHPTTGNCSTEYLCVYCSKSTNLVTEKPTTPGDSVSSDSPKTAFVPNTLKPAINECSYSGNEFFCVITGRFANLNNSSCEKYFLCSYLQNGTFVKRTYNCPKNSKFDPIAGKCSTEYHCPCSHKLTTAVIIKSTFSISATKSQTTPFVSNIFTTHYMNNSYDCTSSGNEFECKKIGRFANLHDLSCQKYFLCSHLHNGTYIKKSYKCPTNSKFYPETGKCSTQFVCPCASNPTSAIMMKTTPTPTRFTTSSMGKTSPVYDCSTSGKTFVCEKTGRFPDENDFYCQKYFLCSHLYNGTFIRKLYKCPTNSKFDPHTGKCSADYLCPCSINRTTLVTVPSSTSLVETTQKYKFTSSTKLHTSPECQVYGDVFTCMETGRYPDSNDLLCQEYFLCSKLKNGTFIQSQYKCPHQSTFNPHDKKCSTKYICPCLPNTKTNSS